MCELYKNMRYFSFRVLVEEMVKELVNVIRNILEMCVINVQLVIITNPTIV